MRYKFLLFVKGKLLLEVLLKLRPKYEEMFFNISFGFLHQLSTGVEHFRGEKNESPSLKDPVLISGQHTGSLNNYNKTT